MEDRVRLSETLAEIFLASLEAYVNENGIVRVPSYDEVEDYLVNLFTDMLFKVYEIKEFEPELFRESLKRRKDLISRYVVFSP